MRYLVFLFVITGWIAIGPAQAQFHHSGSHNHSHGHGSSSPHAHSFGGASGIRSGVINGGFGRTAVLPPSTFSAAPGLSQRTYSSSAGYGVQYLDTVSNHTHVYGTPPGIRQYSAHHHHQQYGYPGVTISPGYGWSVGVSGYRGLLNYGYPSIFPSIYPSIYAPPIVIPYGGLGISAPLGAAFFPSNSLNAVVPPINSGISLPPDPLSVPQTPIGPPATSPADALTFRQPSAADDRRVVNEFGDTESVAPRSAGTIERIQSLRYQTSGDDEFRNGNFSRAAALFQAAADAAPDRRAPWLRLAWAQVAQQKFPEATGSLRQGLVLPDDPTSSWISGAELYGNRLMSDGSLHNEALWDWLQQRPRSTDRLLLTSAFQFLRGSTGAGRELLDAAFSGGLPQQLADGLSTAVKDLHAQQPPDNNLPAPGGEVLPPLSELPGRMKISGESLPNPAVAEDGIRLRGSQEFAPSATELSGTGTSGAAETPGAALPIEGAASSGQPGSPLATERTIPFLPVPSPLPPQ